LGADTDPSITDPSISVLKSPWVTVSLSRPRPSIVLCAVAGEIDLMTAPLLGEQLENAVDGQCRVIAVDLTAVTFFAPVSLRILDEVQRSHGGEHEIILVGASAFLCKLFDLCQLEYPQYSAFDERVQATRS
jgi:anti-anti-sigma factor